MVKGGSEGVGRGLEGVKVWSEEDLRELKEVLEGSNSDITFLKYICFLSLHGGNCSVNLRVASIARFLDTKRLQIAPKTPS